jgi:hypothetical protein
LVEMQARLETFEQQRAASSISNACMASTHPDRVVSPPFTNGNFQDSQAGNNIRAQFSHEDKGNTIASHLTWERGAFSQSIPPPLQQQTCLFMENGGQNSQENDTVVQHEYQMPGNTSAALSAFSDRFCASLPIESQSSFHCSRLSGSSDPLFYFSNITGSEHVPWSFISCGGSTTSSVNPSTVSSTFQTSCNTGADDFWNLFPDVVLDEVHLRGLQHNALVQLEEAKSHKAPLIEQGEIEKTLISATQTVVQNYESGLNTHQDTTNCATFDTAEMRRLTEITTSAEVAGCTESNAVAVAQQEQDLSSPRKLNRSQSHPRLISALRQSQKWIEREELSSEQELFKGAAELLARESSLLFDDAQDLATLLSSQSINPSDSQGRHLQDRVSHLRKILSLEYRAVAKS